MSDVIDATQAQQLGIVREVLPVEALMPKALSLAEQLAAGPTRAFGMDKALLNRSMSLSLDEYLELEAGAEAVIMQSQDHLNAVAAFKDKTTPSSRPIASRDRLRYAHTRPPDTSMQTLSANASNDPRRGSYHSTVQLSAPTMKMRATPRFSFGLIAPSATPCFRNSVYHLP